MARRNVKQIWVDKEVWEDLELVLPNMQNPERSRWLYHEKIIKKIEEKISSMNKKGSFLDFFFLIILLIGFSGSVLLVFAFVSGTNDRIQDNNVFDVESKAMMATNTDAYKNTFDNAFLMFFVLACIGTLALAALVRVHPIFLVFYIIGLIFVIIFAAVGSNMYDEMATNPQLASYAEQFTFIPAIMTYLPILLGTVGSIMAIVMYKLWSNSQ